MATREMDIVLTDMFVVIKMGYFIFPQALK